MPNLPSSVSRSPGDALPPDLIKNLRQRRNLTQDELAARMGVHGGKSVVSGWETGRAPCEGPSAELLLLLLGESGSVDAAALSQDLDAKWKRAKTFLPAWRQTTAVPSTAQQLDRDQFVRLLPEGALTKEECEHGFPSVRDLPPTVFGISSSGWQGAIPPDPSRPPHYLWRLGRDGRFGYRERAWEDERSGTRGHIDIGSMMVITLDTVYWLRKLAQRFNLDPQLRYVLGLNFEGASGRGLVAANFSNGTAVWNDPPRVSSEDHIAASISSEVAEIIRDPVEVGLSLVGEFSALLNPDLATNKALRCALHGYASYFATRPMLGFLKDHPVVLP